MATRIREKAAARKANVDKRPRATATFVRITPKKAGMVLDLVRGKKYDEALAILTNINNASSDVVKKLIVSAGANAENNLNMPKDGLYVAECYATGASLMRRVKFRGRGRVDNRVLKRSCHITIVLDEQKEAK